jgi:phage gp46-like protein
MATGIDINLVRDDNGVYDFEILDGDTVGVEGFDTAIDVSLFTDSRAPADLVPKPEKRRGWMGNTESPVEDRELGGLLWIIDQARLTQDTLNASIDYANKALAWFTLDGIAKTVQVSGSIIPRQGIQLVIVITALDGVTTTHYRNLWEVTGNAN